MHNLKSTIRLGALLAITFAAGCGGSAADTFSGPETIKIKAVSATSVTGKMGDVIPVTVDATALDGGFPPFGTKVAFVASDGGSMSWPSVATSPDGTAMTFWRLGPVAKVQTLRATTDGARPLVLQANVTGNPWTVTTVGSMRYVSRFADEGSFGGQVGGDPWASTMFGSAPRLIISCQAGTVGIAITHPRMQVNGNSTAYSFNDDGSWTRENWSQSATLSDSLFHPGPTISAGTLAKRIAASSAFRLSFYEYFPPGPSNGSFTAEVGPSFGTAGLSQVMPQLMADCPAGR